jgi:hypothetical protein
MAETVIGGAYLSADKKTQHDANGKVINASASAGVGPAVSQSVPDETEAGVLPEAQATAQPAQAVADKTSKAKKA